MKKRWRQHAQLKRALSVLSFLASVTTEGLATRAHNEGLFSFEGRSDSISKTVGIRDLGAKCDGQTDDFDAITAALARAKMMMSGTVVFPPSATACMVSHNLVIPDNVNLWAASGTATVKATSDNTSNPMLLAVGNNVRVEGLSFDGGGRDHMNTANVIQGFKVSNVVFDSIAIRHSHGIGLMMSSSIVNGSIQDSTFEDLGNHWKTSHEARDRAQGVVFCCGSGNRGNKATHNHFLDIGLDALQFSDQTDIAIMGNRFDLEDDQHNMIGAHNFPAAIFPLRVDRAVITDNVIVRSQGNCIDAPGLSNADISRNMMTDCAAAGIGLFDSHTYSGPNVATDKVRLSDNTITNTGHWANTPFPGGITLSGTVTNVLLSGNRVTDNQLIKTQRYAVYGVLGSTLTGLSIDPSNRTDGNSISALGGAVTAEVYRSRHGGTH